MMAQFYRRSGPERAASAGSLYPVNMLLPEG
jgi:hypothetical protein